MLCRESPDTPRPGSAAAAAAAVSVWADLAQPAVDADAAAADALCLADDALYSAVEGAPLFHAVTLLGLLPVLRAVLTNEIVVAREHLRSLRRHRIAPLVEVIFHLLIGHVVPIAR